jgi:small subunit ribosomal protein S21
VVDVISLKGYFFGLLNKAVSAFQCHAEGGVMSMSTITITIDDRFPAEKAIKKFKRLCDAYGIVKEYRARSEYKKPSVKMKEKLENADKRRRKTDVRGKSRSKY